MMSATNRRYSQIGLDRLLLLRWLERTACLVQGGNDDKAVKATLQKELQDSFRSDNIEVRGSLDKTITILMKIWVRPPVELRSFQDSGLRLLSSLPRDYQIAVHWGMAMAVYPFWGAVAAHAGRLLRLQGTAAASQVQRRVREHYGERETVSRRVRYVLRSFVDWEVLEETSDKGVYSQGLLRDIDNVQLVAWLTEAFLHTRPDGTVILKTVFDSTVFFPFRLSTLSAGRLVAESERLHAVSHGLDQDLIMLNG